MRTVKISGNKIPFGITLTFWALVFACLAVGGYLIASFVLNGMGFPLDDAWIHQTYARNLALYHEWSFIPGQPSAGSTAPLWSILLSIGYFVGSGPFSWTFLLGTVSLAALAVTGEMWFRHLNGNLKSLIPWVGLFLAGEWHLVWAAASGMETILFALAILSVFFLLWKGKSWQAGLVIGLAIWIRPDGVTLLGPALFQVVLEAKTWRDRLLQSGRILLGTLPIMAAYLVFNQSISHVWLPNTFFAKQAEYAVYQQFPILERFFTLITLPLIGAGILFLPGFAFFTWQSARRRSWHAIGAILWWIGYTVIYAVRLPVTYQHGRYLMPAMPVYFVLGLAGFFELIRKSNELRTDKTTGPVRRTRLSRLAVTGWSAGIILLWAIMLIVGAVTYAQDVAIINTEMVDTSKWIAANTPQDAVIGAHDIGALGFFGNRKILDLAGLVTPDVIPFIRDQSELALYLNKEDADYLMTFPDWYPDLVSNLSPIYQSSGIYSPGAGGENMAVYKWK